ncbi:MAG: DUF2442 domain-containing protein [Bdellovibrionales bacterium]|nr:DUF2442 domain-containing protein [Bdellovibrionales bacterium]
MICSVVQVKPTNDFKVYVYFNDGKIKLYDMSPFVGKGVFKPLESADFFVERCTVMNDTLAWDVTGTFDPRECIDIAPETIYADGIEITDPLAQEVA